MENNPSNQASKSRRALPIIFFTVFIDLIGFSIVLPILAPLLALPNSSPILPNTPYDQRLIIFGFLVASYAIAQFFATPLIGQLSDRFGRKPLLAISLIGTLVARVMFIVGIVNKDINLLFLSRIVDGITGGNISVAQSAIADISSPENRAKNFGLIGGAFGLGFIIGPYIGGKFAEAGIVNWFAQFLPNWIASASTLPLWFATILCALNIIFVFFIFPETIKEKIHKTLRLDTSLKNVVKAFTVGNLRITFITVFLLMLGFSFFTQFFAVYIGTKFAPEIRQSVEEKIASGETPIVYPSQIEGIPNPVIRQQAMDNFKTQYTEALVGAETQARAANSFSYIGLWVVFAQVVLARQLAKKYKPATLLKWGLLINGIVLFVLLLPDQIAWLFIILPIFALANGLTQPNSTAIISNSADATSQGEVLGINTSVQALAQAIPPVISGYIASRLSVSSPIFVGAAFILLAFVVFTLFYKPTEKVVLHEE